MKSSWNTVRDRRIIHCLSFFFTKCIIILILREILLYFYFLFFHANCIAKSLIYVTCTCGYERCGRMHVRKILFGKEKFNLTCVSRVSVDFIRSNFAVVFEWETQFLVNIINREMKWYRRRRYPSKIFVASDQRNNLRRTLSSVSEEKCVCTRFAIGGYQMDDRDIILRMPTES